jgi:hypothetical protein
MKKFVLFFSTTHKKCPSTERKAEGLAKSRSLVVYLLSDESKISASQCYFCRFSRLRRFLFPGRVIYLLQNRKRLYGLENSVSCFKIGGLPATNDKTSRQASCKPLKPNNHEKTCLQRYCIVSVAAKSSIRSHLQGIPIFLFFLFFL